MVNVKVINLIITAAIALVVAVAVTLSVVFQKSPMLDIDFSKIEAVDNGIKLFEAREKGEYQALAKVDDGGNIVNHDFKILAFTDTHLNERSFTNSRTIRDLIAAIDSEKPDFVVFDGDNALDSANAARYAQLAELMETYGIYWSFVLGNHEGEGEGAISREQTVRLMETFPHCLVKSDDGGVSGEGNYVVNLLGEGGKTVKSLIFMDSGKSSPSSEEMEQLKLDGGYDFLKADQIEWYKNTASNINANCDGAKSMLFLHIPLFEYAMAYDEAVAEANDTTLLYGERRETECSSRYNSGMFDAIKNVQNTEAVFAGHDHVNDYVVKYKGVYLGYVQSSGYSTYGTAKVKGFTRFTVSCGGELKIEQNFYN